MLESVFNLDTFTSSNTAKSKGIDNTKMTDEQFENLKRLHTLLISIQARLSTKYAKPINIKINSGFRSEALNKAVGGVATSQHCKGEAADTTATGLTVEQYFQDIKELIKDNVIDADQVIQEFDKWVHISVKEKANRKQYLRAVKENGKTVYKQA